MTHNPPTSQPDLDAIQARIDAASRGPWKLAYEYCDCSEDCGHGLYVSRIDTGSGPATELCDLPRGEWELMVHARADVEQLVDEVRRLRAKLADEERQHGDTIDDRDHFHEMADKLAYAVAPIEVIGEHSSMNCPWDNALDLITPMAEVDKLRQQLAVFTALAERWEQLANQGDAAIGHFEGPAAATLDAEVGERGRTYRKAAADVRDVVRTGRVPHDLMTGAELDGAEETHVVADDSDDPEHIDDCPGCEPATKDTLPAWLAKRFDPRGADWGGLSDDDRAYWAHQAAAVRRAVARGGFKATTPA